MVKDLVGAMQAVFWGCVLLTVSLTVFSIIAVRFISPLSQDLARQGVYDGCDRCSRAYSSVMNSNLTFLQILIAGDSWGTVTIPIIENYPGTIMFFVPVLAFINLAIMNVILAVIVESAEDARKGDLAARAKAKELDFVHKSRHFLRICQGIDQDNSGDLSLDELENGFEKNEDLAMTLHDMGIEKEDLATIFEIMDEDRSGKVDYKEFVEHIHKMRTADEQTTLNFIRHYVVQILRRVGSVQAKVDKNGNIDWAMVSNSLGVAMNSTGSHASRAKDGTGGTGCEATPRSENDAAIRPPTRAILAPSSSGIARSASANSVSFNDEVLQIRELCDKVLMRFDSEITESIERISQQCKDQISVLNSFMKAHSDSLGALQRRAMDGDRDLLSTPGAGINSRRCLQPPTHCNSVFGQCTLAEKASSAPRTPPQTLPMPSSAGYSQ
jgi:Ca2+-binding EF-hand superfamily protein